MKILFITQEYSSSNAGGAGVYAYELINALVKKNVTIYVVVPGEKTQLIKVNEKLYIYSLHVINKPLFKIATFHFQIFLKAGNFAEKIGANCIHSNNYAGVFIRSKLAFISTIHHLVVRELPHIPFFQRIIFIPDIFFELLTLCRSKKIIAVSHYTADLIAKRNNTYKQKVTIVLNGIDVINFRKTKNNVRKNLGIPANTLILFFPGGARTRRKGALILLKALMDVKYSNYVCIVSGESRETKWAKELERRVEQSRLQSKFKWVGEIEYNSLPLYYSAADIVIYPSTFEGFGLPVLEALACARPIICTRTGEAHYIVKSGINGLLVDIHDYIDLADKIRILITNEGLRRKFSKNARKSIINYSWSNPAQKTIHIYKDAMRSPEQ